jgi:hypothetical protein
MVRLKLPEEWIKIDQESTVEQIRKLLHSKKRVRPLAKWHP